jgi:murein DD-endopeptidase MepM/ murein hydrolase activator NlpD
MLRGAAAASALLVLAGCDGGFGGIGDMFRGDNPAEGALETLARPDPDARGVITYNTYQVIVARNGDSIDAMAGRVGLTGKELADHNGLPVGYRPRAGEVLALPKYVGGTPADNVWSPAAISGAIDSAPLDGGISATPLDSAGSATGAAAGSTPFANGQQGNVVDPIRHRVQPGETAFTIARLYGVSETALASWNGLDRKLTVREGQELLIPLTAGAPRTESATGTAAPGESTPLPPPPSAAQPLPENQDVAVAEPLPEAPDLGLDDQPEDTAEPVAEAPEAAPQPAPQPGPGALRLSLPVEGPVILPYSAQPGPKKNEGIDIGAAAGTPVKAAAAGEIAYVSESQGLGTIVLIRHDGDIITVYGRISDVKLKKGDRVGAGERIGVVADNPTPNVHFEVRRGSAAVDPTPFL